MKKEKELKEIIEYDVIEYYRFIRNNFIHALGKESNKFESQIKQKIKTTKYNLLSAPNKFNEMKFDDFILFTRAIKKLAKLFNHHYKLTNSQIIESIKQNHKSKLNKFSNNYKRKRNLIKQLLKIDYNIFDENIITEIMKD